MNIDKALVEAESAEPASALFMVAAEVSLLRLELAAAPKVERERLAAWFEQSADTLRGFQPDGLSVEFVVFLLRLAGE